jgi:hypothetical protein
MQKLAPGWQDLTDLQWQGACRQGHFELLAGAVDRLGARPALGPSRPLRLPLRADVGFRAREVLGAAEALASSGCASRRWRRPSGVNAPKAAGGEKRGDSKQWQPAKRAPGRSKNLPQRENFDTLGSRIRCKRAGWVRELAAQKGPSKARLRELIANDRERSAANGGRS